MLAAAVYLDSRLRRSAGGDHEADCKMDAGSFRLKARYLRKL